jgi:hypothetical protein
MEATVGKSVKIGSLAHRDIFCSHFMRTYTEYDPQALPWPELADAELARLRGVPFWQEVFYTERRAAAIVAAFAETVEDPVLKEAILLQGREERRHGDLIRVMIHRYDIEAEESPLEAIDGDLLTRFKDFGFGECMDSFLGFGVFKLALQSKFLPRSMFDIFETLMYEETRHIVFFVNWMAYTEARRGLLAQMALPLTSLVFYVRAVRRMAGLARRGAEVNDGRDFNTTQAAAFLDHFTFLGFLEDCYSENRRRMGALDPELLKPSFLPQLAKAALGPMRLWSNRAAGAL